MARSSLGRGVLLAISIAALVGRQGSAAPGRRIEDVPLEELLAPVSGASKHEQRQEQAPSSVTVLTSDEIARFGYRTLAEILGAMAGVFTTDDRNYTYLAVRGFGVPGDYSSRVLLLIDGHRYNDAVFGTAAVGSELAIDVQTIDRVELIRGPGSSLYGSNAFFAVVNVITKKGASARGLAASAGAGSLGAYRLSLAYGDRFGDGDGLDLRLSAAYERSRGDPLLRYKELDDGATIARMDGEETARFSASARYRGLTAQGAFTVRRKDVPTAAFGTVVGDPRFRTTDASGFAVLAFRHAWRSRLELQARVAVASYRYDGEYPYRRAEAITINRDEATGTWWGGELLLSRRFLDRLKLSLGGELRHELQLDQSNVDLDPPTRYLDSRESSWVAGAFGQIEWEIWRERLLLSAGVRYDQTGGVSGSTNPRVALIFTPPTRTAIKLLFGTAFRAPNAYERFYVSGDPALGSAQVRNPGLRPERIQTHEAIVEQTILERLRAVVSGYYYRIDDLIRFSTIDALDNYSFSNVAQVDALGLEAALELRGWRDLLGRASYAIQRAWDRSTDLELANSPRHLFKAQLSLPLYRDRLYLSGRVRYMTERRRVDGGITPGHVVGDLALLLSELPRGLTLALSVRNLFDARYADPASDAHRQREIEQVGRTFFLEATYRPDWRR